MSTYDFGGNEQALKDVRVSWYYNWSPNRTKTNSNPGVEFVPMIWGAANVNASTLNAVKGQGTHLLGFNEPDFKEQANMSPEKALELWPQLQGTGMRLGSPSVAFGGDRAGGWLDTFMNGANARGYRVDFITLHWYGGDFSAAAVGQLRGYIEAVYNRYRKPIWLTEFALMRFESSGAVVPTQAQQVAFVKGATAMLQSLSYVERYAWFSLPAKEANSTGLYSSGSTTTEVGAAYRAVN
ncbi:RNA polymerase [Virgisporangium aliadipatigenens]|uniref:RNA polymerase n=1 Tax=Virgisporangium aliadipatigenens TaxID=741659 RepID=A0A8J3YHU2_9ACTN|nr:RNA polymerase [Virgisporangium aliadipatigenens]